LILRPVTGLTARLGWWPVSATAVPPQWESKFAQTTLQAALAHQPAGLTNPLSPSNEVLIAGLKSFKMKARMGMMADEEIWKVVTFLERIGSLPLEIQTNWEPAQ